MNAFSVDESDLATGPIPDWLPDKVSIFRGDITKLEIDAIANAANETLLGGGGVDGAIHRGAGGLLLQECRTLNGCETGQAKITCGYTLPAKCEFEKMLIFEICKIIEIFFPDIVHTVGPVGEKPELLKSCYETSLKLMADNNLRTIVRFL
jgi:O-acetyl-ADP-ribose deacetylase (regulator of RNase III)